LWDKLRGGCYPDLRLLGSHVMSDSPETT